MLLQISFFVNFERVQRGSGPSLSGGGLDSAGLASMYYFSADGEH